MIAWVQEATEAGAQEAALSNFEWGTLFAFLALVATVIYGEIQRRGQREQLRLAREQDARRLDLVVEEVRLVDPEDIPSIVETIREVEEEWREEAQEEEERRNLAGASEIDKLAWKVSRWSAGSGGFGETYHGSLPDKVLQVRVRNNGAVTATGVEVTVYLQDKYLEPLGYFTDAEVRHHADDENDPCGVYAVSLGGRDLDLPPGLEHYDLLVAVLVRSPGTARVITTLATATTSIEDAKDLEISADPQ